MENDCDPVSVKCSPEDSVDGLKALFIAEKKLDIDRGKLFLFFGEKLDSTAKVASCLHDGARVTREPAAAAK